jgi:hypothetical protein
VLLTVARVIWKENALVNLKLKVDLFTIGQMLRGAYMRFYNIQSTDGCWKNIDLNEVESLFTVPIGNVVLQQLATGKIKDKTVIPSIAPFEKYWIKPKVNNDGGSVFKGGKLIERIPGVPIQDVPVIKKHLKVDEDWEIIDKYELTNMWGAHDLSERLIRFFETGDKTDYYKAEVFPGYKDESSIPLSYINRMNYFSSEGKAKEITWENIEEEMPTITWRRASEEGDEHYTEEDIAQSEQAFEQFVKEIKQLGEKPSEEKVLESVKKVVTKFNELDETYFSIETVEREQICDFIDKVVTLTGLKFEGDVTEEWRTW